MDVKEGHIYIEQDPEAGVFIAHGELEGISIALESDSMEGIIEEISAAMQEMDGEIGFHIHHIKHETTRQQ